MNRMFPIVPLLTLGAALALPSPAAAATCNVPNAIANGQVADASKIMDNFTAIANCAQQGVTTTGTPTTGSIPIFSGPGSITSGNLTGDVTTSGGTATTLSSSGVAPGTYASANITVDAKGRITSASNGSAGGASTYWGYAAAGSSVPEQVNATITSGSAYQSPNNALGPFPSSIWWWNGGITTGQITFDFGEAVVISGIAFFQDSAGDQGNWQVSASQDNVTYTDLGSPGDWTGNRSSIVFANSNSYRYWKITQVSGVTNNGPNQQLFMFRWGPHT